MEAINFEWPTQYIFDRMPADTTLSYLTFKSAENYRRVNSIQCKLSNGMESPVFENSDLQFKSLTTLSFSNDRPVRSIHAYEGASVVCRLDFLDRNGAEICKFENSMGKGPGNTYQIAENERLIGVYGVKGKENWFTSFGFIVKVQID